ncbi:TetR/AcrR family transcriptional regulator [Aeromicrobium sp. UC242_57]|uniref:TetR/AcrR family transcriptional regulator n=1 Tax=Aeromicrobium sp. UC242_57 TaxID=3374624 RepID=UPI0037A59AAA
MSEIAKRRAAAAASADTNPAYQERVELIRRAAGKVFHQRGFRGTSSNDIAAEAGVDRASLYYYVGSKEQLFRDVVSEAVSANIAAAHAVSAMDAPAAEKLSMMIQSLMKSFEEHYPYMYVFVQEDVAKLATEGASDQGWSETVQAWNTDYFQLVRQTIADGIADGSFQTPLPAGVAANCIIGMLNYSNLWFKPNGLMDADEIGKGISQLPSTACGASHVVNIHVDVYPVNAYVNGVPADRRGVLTCSNSK